jgi:hypothetical protein
LPAIPVEGDALRSHFQSDDDAGDAKWFPFQQATLDDKVKFAFDHAAIVQDCVRWFNEHGRARGLFVEVDAA